VERGDAVTAVDTEVLAQATRPPKPFDDATLLGAMEGAGRSLDDEALRRALRGSGLGTPATRASILQTLIERTYVVRDGRALRATDRGHALVSALPVAELKSAELTGRWEARLFAMAEGRETRASFLSDVEAHVREVVAAIAAAAPPAGQAGERVGRCPTCGGDVVARRSAWACAGTCAFSVPRRIAGRAISDRMRDQLMRGAQTALVKGFKRKDGKGFSAALRWDSLVSRVASVCPDGRRARPEPPKVAAPAEGDPCPSCGSGTVIRGRERLGCSRWREGCAWRDQSVQNGM
jgi:DNA topoisomerase-3